MVVTIKPNPAYLKCFSRLSLLKEPSLSVDIMSNSASVFSQSCCITWQLMWISDRRASLPGFTSPRTDLRSARRARSSAWISKGRSASVSLPTLRYVLDCEVLLLVVFVLGCLQAAPVLNCSLSCFPMTLSTLNPAVLICDMSYLLMWSVFLLYLRMSFLVGASKSVCFQLNCLDSSLQENNSNGEMEKGHIV